MHRHMSESANGDMHTTQTTMKKAMELESMGQSAKEVSLAAQGLGQLAGLRIICINSGENTS